MSLIESALQRLRRAEDARSGRLTPSGAGVLAAAVKVPPAVVPAPEETVHSISIDFRRLRDAGYLPEVGMERRFADYYRRVKRPLVEKALSGGADMRLILVTSALPGDGKTFTSINLALSMARERDVSVLLIDADGPRARISEVFGVRQKPGLLDALADESLDVESLIQRTDVRGLELLPAGRFIENATELLASGRMGQIATRLAARSARRVVVFDSAPLLAASEARAMIRLPGQIILVVRAGVSSRRAIFEAVAQIDKQKLRGLVVNQARPGPGAGYSYGDYLAYGESAEESARRQPDGAD